MHEEEDDEEYEGVPQANVCQHLTDQSVWGNVISVAPVDFLIHLD